MGMVKLLSDGEQGLTQNNYEFVMAASADELTPKLLQGELDVLAVPVNLGAILYNNTEGAVQMAAVNTLGVVYILEKGGEEINSLEDLKGQTIMATGKGTTPEFALSYLLSQHGLELGTDVTVEWKSEPTETIAAMTQMDHAIVMLPQPFVTVAQGQVEGLRMALDLTAEWEKLDNGSQFITAGLVVRKAFAEENPQALATFLEEYQASTEYVNNNVSEAAQLVEQYDIVKAAVAEQAIPYCNIVYIDKEEMQTAVSGYLQNPLRPEARFGRRRHAWGRLLLLWGIGDTLEKAGAVAFALPCGKSLPWPSISICYWSPVQVFSLWHPVPETRLFTNHCL